MKPQLASIHDVEDEELYLPLSEDDELFILLEDSELLEEQDLNK